MMHSIIEEQLARWHQEWTWTEATAAATKVTVAVVAEVTARLADQIESSLESTAAVAEEQLVKIGCLGAFSAACAYLRSHSCSCLKESLNQVSDLRTGCPQAG